MQVFEFHFNKKAKPDLIFDSFCYDPENVYEKRAGRLFMAGILKNVLPQNIRFLDNLARTIKERYYNLTLRNPEKSLNEGLKAGNELLDNISKKGDVSWLGNLNFAVLALKNYDLNFTKVGEMKIFLLRRGHIIDIDKRLKFQDLEPYPLKVFPNIVSGKLIEDDVILVLTKDVFDSFKSLNLIAEIANIFPLEEKRLKEIFQRKSQAISKIIGVCLLLSLNKNDLSDKRQMIGGVILPKKLKKFSLKNVFIPLIRPFSKKLAKFKIAKFSAQRELRSLFDLRFYFAKARFLILALIIFLVSGFFIARREENQRLKSYQATFNQIQKKADQGLLNDAWEEISSLSKSSSVFPENFKNEVVALQNKISQNLSELNKLTIVENPVIIADIDPKDIVPSKIISQGSSIYLFNPFSQGLLKISPEGKNEIILQDKKFNLATELDNSVLFFSKPNEITVLKEGQFSEIALLEPNWDFNFEKISSFGSNLYFWDKKTGQILKYPYLGNFAWASPVKWLLPQTKKAVEINSMAVDGNVWTINQDNSISRYYAGQFQETLDIDIFPAPKGFTKILVLPSRGTNSPIYLLEPAQKRVVILDKNGEIIKQFQGKSFDNLLDFTVSADGRTIWLLNGQKIYKILF